MTDRKLKAVAKSFRDGMLETGSPLGWCGLICWPLASLLEAQGLRVRAVELKFRDDAPTLLANHVVIELPDGRVLDPTADQFGIDPVYLGTLAAAPYGSWS